MYNFTVYIIFSCRYEQVIKKIHVASQGIWHEKEGEKNPKESPSLFQSLLVIALKIKTRKPKSPQCIIIFLHLAFGIFLSW